MARLNKNGLTDQQQEFCDAYLLDPEHNGKKAAIAAKYSPARAASTASRLLATNGNVRKYIDDKLAAASAKAMKRFEITQDRILQELACMAFLDISDLMDENGNFLPLSEIPEHARRAIVGMDFEELYEYSRGERQQVGNVRKVKLGDKKGALELLGKNQKMWTDRFEGEFTQVNMSASLPRESKQ